MIADVDVLFITLGAEHMISRNPIFTPLPRILTCRRQALISFYR